MNLDKYGFKKTLPKRAYFVVVLSVVLLCGCTYALHPYNAPSQQTLKIVAPVPQNIIVRVDDGFGETHKDYAVSPDGLVRFDVPALPRGCAVRLFNVIKIADSRSEDVRAIHLVKDDKVVRKLSLNDISKLSVDSQGVRLMKVK